MATNNPTTPAASGAGDAPETTATAAPAARSGAGRALAITGIAVGSALTLGLTFAGGVALGQALPGGPGGPGDRAPISAEAGGAPGGQHGDRLGERSGERIGDRVEQRMDARMEQRQEQRDELRAQFEQWLQEQGIDPSELPGPPAP